MSATAGTVKPMLATAEPKARLMDIHQGATLRAHGQRRTFSVVHHLDEVAGAARVIGSLRRSRQG